MDIERYQAGYGVITKKRETRCPYTHEILIFNVNDYVVLVSSENKTYQLATKCHCCGQTKVPVTTQTQEEALELATDALTTIAITGEGLDSLSLIPVPSVVVDEAQPARGQ